MATFPYKDPVPKTAAREERFGQATSAVNITVRDLVAAWLLQYDQGFATEVNLYATEVQARNITTEPTTGAEIRAYVVARELEELWNRGTDWSDAIDFWLSELQAAREDDGALLWEFVLERNSVATVVKGGVLTEVEAGVARRGDSGVLLESDATNYLINSKLINDGSTATGFTNGGAGSISFNDLTLYSEVILSSTADRSYLQRPVNVLGAGVKVLSVFVKNLTTIQIQETLRLYSFTGITIDEWRFNGEVKAATDTISGDGLIELEVTVGVDVSGNMRVGVGVLAGNVTASGTFDTPQVEDDITTGRILTGTGGTETRETDYATSPISTSQVDRGVYAGNYTSGGYANGVDTTGGFLSFINTSGVAGKYTSLVTTDWDGAIAVGSNGATIKLTQVDTQTVSYVILDESSDAEIQAGFENTGDSSNLFTIYFHTSAYSLANVKTLRSNVGDGSTWVDAPTNDFTRKFTNVTINTFTANGADLLLRAGTTSDESLTYGHTTPDTSLLIAYTVNTVSALGVLVTIPNFDKSIPITSIEATASSTSGATLTVIHDGTTYTSNLPTDTMGADQGTKDEFQRDLGSGFSHSIGSASIT